MTRGSFPCGEAPATVSGETKGLENRRCPEPRRAHGAAFGTVAATTKEGFAHLTKAKNARHRSLGNARSSIGPFDEVSSSARNAHQKLRHRRRGKLDATNTIGLITRSKKRDPGNGPEALKRLRHPRSQGRRRWEPASLHST